MRASRPTATAAGSCSKDDRSIDSTVYYVSVQTSAADKKQNWQFVDVRTAVTDLAMPSKEFRHDHTR